MPEPDLCTSCRLPLRPLAVLDAGRVDVVRWCPACGRHEVERGEVRESKREG